MRGVALGVVPREGNRSEGKKVQRGGVLGCGVSTSRGLGGLAAGPHNSDLPTPIPGLVCVMWGSVPQPWASPHPPDSLPV